MMTKKAALMVLSITISSMAFAAGNQVRESKGGIRDAMAESKKASGQQGKMAEKVQVSKEAEALAAKLGGGATGETIQSLLKMNPNFKITIEGLSKLKADAKTKSEMDRVDQKIELLLNAERIMETGNDAQELRMLELNYLQRLHISDSDGPGGFGSKEGRIIDKEVYDSVTKEKQGLGTGIVDGIQLAQTNAVDNSKTDERRKIIKDGERCN